MDRTQTDCTPGDDPGKTALQRSIDNYLRTRTDSYAHSARSELQRWLGWLDDRGHDVDALQEEGDRIMRRYAQRLAQRVDAGGLAASTATTYWGYLSGFLSYAVRDGLLDRNPALAERATEELPDDSSERTAQQFWSDAQRQQIVRYTRDRAYGAVDEQGYDALVERRDHALVAVLAYTGVRGAEVLRHPDDDRDGRDGLRWGDVDLERGVMQVLGKSQRREPALLPDRAADPLRQWRRVQRPASEDWPVFPTDHAPSKYGALRDAVGDDLVDDFLEDPLGEREGTVDDLLREHDVAPPALTTEGARSLMRQLTDAAGIDVDHDAGYLTLHGARRGLGDTIYRRDRGQAQDVLRHQSLSTTRDAYQHVDAEEQADQLSDLLEDVEE
jgi:integrase